MAKTPDVRDELAGSHILISCEGGAEDFIVRMLLDHRRFAFGWDNVIDVTRLRKASDIERQYLGFEYDRPVRLLRIVDSLRAGFQLGALYRGRCTVHRVCTRPEIEVLNILNEGRYADYERTRLKPSDYCKQQLGMVDVKRPEFLASYWSVDDLAACVREYARIHRAEPNEHTLADLLKT